MGSATNVFSFNLKVLSKIKPVSMKCVAKQLETKSAELRKSLSFHCSVRAHWNRMQHAALRMEPVRSRTSLYN